MLAATIVGILAGAVLKFMNTVNKPGQLLLFQRKPSISLSESLKADPSPGLQRESA